MYNLKASITFEFDPNNVHSDQRILKTYSKVLSLRNIHFQVAQSRDTISRKPFPDASRVYISFVVDQEVKHQSSVHYISLILQGEAGLLLLFPEVLSFSFALTDS